MRRTPNTVETEIITRIFSGDAYKAISADTGVAVSTIKKIKKRNYDAFWAYDSDSKVSLYREMCFLHARVLARISDRIAEDDLLDRSEIPIMDLIAVAKEMHRQIEINFHLRKAAKLPTTSHPKYL